LTLVEVLVAMAIVVVAVLGATELFGAAIRATRAARHLTSATALAVQEMEQLRALTWGVPELASSPSGALDRNTPGYVDFLDAAGRWVGAGPVAPGSAAFVRRWSIARLPEDPDDTLVLQVLVTRATGESGVTIGSEGPRPRLASDALITTIRTRKLP
jgi:type II secretory pathway pseudopilin PulG